MKWNSIRCGSDPTILSTFTSVILHQSAPYRNLFFTHEPVEAKTSYYEKNCESHRELDGRIYWGL